MESGYVSSSSHDQSKNTTTDRNHKSKPKRNRMDVDVSSFSHLPPHSQSLNSIIPKKKKKRSKPITHDGDDIHTDASNYQEPKSTGPFQKKWTHEDEVQLLEGAINFKNQTNSEPSANIANFYDVVPATLKVPYTKRQLREKVRRLKEKYLKNTENNKNNKVDFLHKQDWAIFKLSKKVWDNESSVAPNQDDVRRFVADISPMMFSRIARDGGIGDDVLHKCLQLMAKREKNIMLERNCMNAFMKLLELKRMEALALIEGINLIWDYIVATRLEMNAYGEEEEE